MCWTKLTRFLLRGIYYFLLLCHPGEGNAPPIPPISPLLFIATTVVLAAAEDRLSVSLRPDLRYQVEKVAAPRIAHHAHQDHQV